MGDHLMSESEIVVINASGLVLGRLASVVAKRLLNGDRIIIVNAEKAKVSGNRKSVLGEAISKLGRRTLGAQWKGPKHPRRPDGIVRRTVRGMLPWKKQRGRDAYRRLKVYIGVPEELKGVEPQIPTEAKPKSIGVASVSVEDIAKGVGWKAPSEE